MAERKDLLKKTQMPLGQRTKARLDEWVNENVNVPLAERGMEDTGAALSAAISASGELLIPDDLADAAMALIPGARILKAGKKGIKVIRKAAPAIEKVLDYGKIRKAETAARKAGEEAADTLQYTKGRLGQEVKRVPGKKTLAKAEQKRQQQGQKPAEEPEDLFFDVNYGE